MPVRTYVRDIEKCCNDIECNECKHCTNGFDELQSVNEEALTKCPVCGCKVKRTYLGSNYLPKFKGPGFYSNGD